jgi:hypothetical protein
LTDNEKDEFENYLEGPVPVNPDDFDKDPANDDVVKQKCDEFYRQIISAFKTWSAEDQVENHFKIIDKQREYDNITRAIINSLRDTRPDSLPTPKENGLTLDKFNPTLQYSRYIPIIGVGGSRKYIRRRFKKSKSKSKKSKPKSKSKSNRKSKSKSKSKRRHKK